MKGFIFTEFLDLVEAKFGFAMVDKIINQSKLKSNGAYTSVGTYDFSEMLRLLTNLSDNTDISIDDLLLVYSKHLFQVLIRSYPKLIEKFNDPIEFLASIQNHIHVEVMKIYPDAQLPNFKTIKHSDNKLIMLYTSERALYMLGRGLIDESFIHFNMKGSVTYEKLNERGTEVKFVIEKL